MVKPADTKPDRPSNAKTTVWIVAAIALFAAVAVGVYGLWLTPNTTPTTPVSTTTLDRPTMQATSSIVDPTFDPQGYSRQVAAMLFNWDTTRDTPASITTRLVDLSDPTGDETPGLALDITMFLPSIDVWEMLGGYHTTQTLQIDSVTIPESWEGVAASASPDQILPGTIAYTISGTRHRDGIVDGRVESSVRPVSFTMFITCQPSFNQCHLMRLGQPDKPMN